MNNIAGNAITVAIIEDDTTIRDGYTELINSSGECKVVCSFGSYEDAAKRLMHFMPQVILLDIQLPGISGTEAIPKLKRLLPDTYILMLTVYEDELQIFRALGNGASGYLTKGSTPQKIIDAIKEVNEGGGPMSAHIAKMVITSFKRNDHSPLSRRETEILEQIATGKSRKRIASYLFIDLETVKSHIKNIYVKLDVHSKADALKLARDNRYI
ncbi:MAG: DNA-binding response regulator [Chitinophagia bacterium]|nr:DNA-binding response regulator [Chitinophagia bacterium]